MTEQKSNIILTSPSEDGEHLIVINNYKDGNDRHVDCSIKLLSSHTFFERISIGFKYIFGLKPNNGFISFRFNRKHSTALMEVVTKLNTDTNLIAHAIKEFELAGYFSSNDPTDALASKQIVELLSVFSTHGHSGGSAPAAISLFNKLVKYNILSPLTFKDSEWSDVTKYSGNKNDILYQNKRDSRIFKDSKGVYNVEAFAKNPKYTKYFGTNILVENTKDISYSGGSVFESNNGIATGRGFRRCYFKDETILKGLIPSKTIYLTCAEIEVTQDDWLMFVEARSSALRQLKSLYTIEWFNVPTLKGKPIITLTHNHGY